MRAILFTIVSVLFILSQLVSCAHSPDQKRNSELIVHYEGQEVHRAGSKYSSLQQLEHKLSDKTKKKFIIFSARWCSSCKTLDRALNEMDNKEQITLLDIDESWVRSLASTMGINSVPTLVVVGENDEIKRIIIGPSRIVLHLVINLD